MKAIDALCAYLADVPAGSIDDTRDVEKRLCDCWENFQGSSEQSMAGYKLQGRMEDVSWDPPRLQFINERHGATVKGSSRAELHRWVLDLENLTATCESAGHRQLRSMQKRLDVGPLAAEVVGLILSHLEDSRIKWYPDGRVRVMIGEVLPAGSAVQQTLTGRRKRFRKAVDERLLPLGWYKIRENYYGPQK